MSEHGSHIAHPVNFSAMHDIKESLSPPTVCWVISKKNGILFHICKSTLCHLDGHDKADALDGDCELLVGDVEEDVLAVLIFSHDGMVGVTSQETDEDQDP